MTTQPVSSFQGSIERFRRDANLSEQQKQDFSLSNLQDVEHAIKKLLLGAYGEISDVIHGVKNFDQLFRNHEDVRRVLEIYFDDVLQFHKCVLDVFARPGWRTVFGFTWRTFQTRSKPIIDSLKRHRALLVDEKLTAVIEEIQGPDSVAKQKLAMTTNFDAPDYEADQRSAASQRLPSSSSGDWVLSEPAFLRWVSGNTSSDALLYLNGGPGTGQEKQPWYRGLSITYERCADQTNSTFSDLNNLQDLAKSCLSAQNRTWIVLDGLDESESKKETCKIIELDHNNRHANDLGVYCKMRAAEIRSRFDLDVSEEEDIIKRVTDTAKGMFMYARVVLDNLESQPSQADVEDELSSDKFPKDLNQAYERVAIRVLGNKDKPKLPTQQSAAIILGWVFSAARPLRWREIQARFCINVDSESCNFRRRRVDSCKALCGSLVEVEDCEMFGTIAAEQVVHLVHETARIYLTSRPFTEPTQTNHPDVALSGYYGFQDYAVKHWAHRLEQIASEPHALLQVSHVEPIEAASRLFTFATPNTLMDMNGPLVESHGIPRFKCPKIHCHFFEIGFEQCAPRDKHVDDHDRPFRCPEADCYAQTTGFSTQSSLNEHVRRFHTDREGRTMAEVQGLTIPMRKSTWNKETQLGKPPYITFLLTFAKWELTLDASVRQPQQNHRGRSALEIAAKRGHQTKCIKLLATGRVDTRKRNSQSGQTVFSTAAASTKSWEGLLELLYKADPVTAFLKDATTQGLAPLHHVLRSAISNNVGNAVWLSEKLDFLLTLPEVDKLIEQYLSVPEEH
ncbi:hypothetical protein B0T22DRAFT_438844 [Podospora appendiculata]|uniref:GPI inositol-deacylase winged helix domain-containing protein n=1 Tax=Podospora appendiculata TaxID=314037 RepID=A0AAE0X6R9_9PEZI|nr:hypothetical protein B0T22DRAFT_438844 [Podospora appendiculata]